MLDERAKIRSIDRKQDKVKEELVQMGKEMCVQFVYDYRSQEYQSRYKSVAFVPIRYDIIALLFK